METRFVFDPDQSATSGSRLCCQSGNISSRELPKLLPRSPSGAFFYLNSSELDCKSLIPGSKKQPEALHAFKSRGFGGEIGLVTANSPLAPALFTWAAAWTSALLLIQIKVPRSAPAYAFILCKQSPLQ